MCSTLFALASTGGGGGGGGEDQKVIQFISKLIVASPSPPYVQLAPYTNRMTRIPSGEVIKITESLNGVVSGIMFAVDSDDAP